MNARRAAAALLTAALLVLHLVAAFELAGREPHVDEIETLHAAWLMAQGERLYETFFEHHSPFLFSAFSKIPASEDIREYFADARVLSGAFGFVAMLAFAAIVWRARPEAVPIAAALLLASLPLWIRTFLDIRPEPFSLAFFWTGAALVLLPRSRAALASGIGVAFVAIAALWNPKWPLCSLVVAGFWIARMRGWDARRIAASIGIVLAIVAAAVFAMSRIAPLDRTWFFMIDFNVALARFAGSQDILDTHFHGGVPFLFEPPLLDRVVMLVAFVIVVAGLARDRAVAVFRERRIIVFLLLVALATALELRFTFPYPVLWPHYFSMWSFAAAALAGLVPAALGAALRSARVGTAVAAVAMLIACVQIAASGPFGMRAEMGPYWVSHRYLQRHLREGETVWLDIRRHPVTVRDAHFYWYSIGGVGTVARELLQTPRGARFLPPANNLPLCSIVQGKRTNLRFVTGPKHLGLPDELQCFARLFEAGRIRATPVPEVFELVY